MPWSADFHRGKCYPIIQLYFSSPTAVEQILSTSVLWVPLGIEVYYKILFPRAWNLDRINEHAYTKLCGASSSWNSISEKGEPSESKSSCRKLQEGGAIENKPDLDKELNRLKGEAHISKWKDNTSQSLEVGRLGCICETEKNPSWLGQEGEPFLHSPFRRRSNEDQTKPEAEAMRGRWALVMA